MKFSLKLYHTKKTGFCILIGFIVCFTAKAQEYKYEIGGMAGMTMYMGDVNKTQFFRGWRPGFGAVFRRNFDFRWALKTNLLMGGISGNSQNTDNVFFEGAEAEFSRTFYELGGQMEFNFLPYSDKFAYLQTSKIAPYTMAGLGITYASGEESFFSPNLSIGVGVKYKIKNRINLGLEYSFRKLFSDSFDAPNSEGFSLDNPYGIKSGFLKNKDWYSVFMFSVTWDFGPNEGACNNNLQ